MRESQRERGREEEEEREGETMGEGEGEGGKIRPGGGLPENMWERKRKREREGRRGLTEMEK